jgi:methyl-accepting chemotaxis protein
MDTVTQKNAANAEESASAAEELSSQAEELNGMVGELEGLVRGAAAVQKSQQQLDYRQGGSGGQMSGRSKPKPKGQSHLKKVSAPKKGDADWPDFDESHHNDEVEVGEL